MALHKGSERTRLPARIALLITTIALSVAVLFSGSSIGEVAMLLQATSSSSASPTPAASGSATASAAPSTSPSASTQPSPSSSGAPQPRAISISSSDRKVDVGSDVRISGNVLSTSNACEAQESVQLRRRFVGGQFRLIRSLSTDASGDFATTLEVRRSAEYKATVFRTDECDTAASDNVPVFVRVRVTINSSSNPVSQGNFFTISGRVRPRHARTDVILERKVTRGWAKVDRVRLTRESRYTFSLVAGWMGERSFRVRWPSQDHDHEPSASRVLTLRST